MTRCVDIGARALFALAAAALAAVVAVTVYEVVSRYVWGAPTIWVADVTGVLLAWSIAFAAPEVTRRQGHVAITVLSGVGPWRAERARLLEWASSLVCGGAAWIVGSEAWRQVERGITTQGATQLPKAWITAALALGLFWTAIVFVRLALRAREPKA